jgi:NAD-dependent deacetylase
MQDEIHQVASWLSAATRAVAFTGAGISTESGIPDFRSPGGVWATNQPVYFDDFVASADARYEYWRQKAISHRDFVSGLPNAGHRMLAKWELDRKLKAVVTQNIDGLHQDAGSVNVFELHGTARFVSCLDCQARFDADPMVKQFETDDAVPPCPECNGKLKHATVSFGQQLPADVLEEAIRLSKRADVFLAMGSSLVVEPAASLPRLAKQHGSKLVIVNRDATPLDVIADIVINASIGESMTEIDECMA